MTKKEETKREAIERLRELIGDATTIHTILRSVSRSGMSGTISVVVMRTDDDGNAYALHPNYAVSEALGVRLDARREGLKVSGCGMDMGFWLVYNIGRALYPDGYPCTGEHCRSNDHSNGLRDRTPGAHHHADGGYYFRSEWL